MRSFVRREPLKEVPSDLLGGVEFGARLAKALLELDQLRSEVCPLSSVTGRQTDVGAAGCPNLNKPLVGEQLNRGRCRVHCNAVLRRQLAIGGQPLARRV